MAGLEGIAHPSEGAVELALALGREVQVSAACCSIAASGDAIAAGGDAPALDDPSALRVDPGLLARAKRPIERIRVVAR
jgi:hypothetical protein